MKYQIVDGPDWDSFHSYHGEAVEFQVMKMEAHSGDDANVLLTLRPVLCAPVELCLEVDHVASPIHDSKKIIRGKIVNEISHGALLSEFKDSVGILFLKKGLDVEIEYVTNTRTGFVTFENHSGQDWLRVCKNGSWLNSLESMDYSIGDKGTCYEVAFYACLSDPKQNLQQIHHANNIGRYAEISDSGKPSLADIFLEESLLRKSAPVVWI